MHPLIISRNLVFEILFFRSSKCPRSRNTHVWQGNSTWRWNKTFNHNTIFTCSNVTLFVTIWLIYLLICDVLLFCKFIIYSFNFLLFFSFSAEVAIDVPASGGENNLCSTNLVFFFHSKVVPVRLFLKEVSSAHKCCIYLIKNTGIL